MYLTINLFFSTFVKNSDLFRMLFGVEYSEKTRKWAKKITRMKKNWSHRNYWPSLQRALKSKIMNCIELCFLYLTKHIENNLSRLSSFILQYRQNNITTPIYPHEGKLETNPQYQLIWRTIAGQNLRLFINQNLFSKLVLLTNY